MNLGDLRIAARVLRNATSTLKSDCLVDLSSRLLKKSDEILAANAQDLAALAADSNSAFRDRLTLNPDRLAHMRKSLEQVAALPDPVGERIETKILPNGLKLEKVRGPLGCIFMIFESRPNVITEAFSLAFKSGNAILLRGGSESKCTAAVLYACIRESLEAHGLSPVPFIGLEDYDRARVGELLLRSDIFDVVVPRGGEKLIRLVVEQARMPIIKNDRGMCHCFIEGQADLDMAVKIVANAKVSRPGVCNSLETVLLERSVAQTVLPRLFKAMPEVAWNVDEESRAILGDHPRVRPAREKDWDTESLNFILNCRVVADLEEALTHIERHGSRHSEAIVTADTSLQHRFQTEVDAAVVYVNASTRFTDGFEFGLGGELGISTQKIHVRGPVGLRELTVPRWIATGTGQIRE